MTKNFTHVCTDLEGWGTRSGYDLRSIGACVFNPYGNSVAGQPSMSVADFPKDTAELDPKFYYYQAVDNPLMGLYSLDHFSQTELDMIDGPNRRYNLRRDPRTVRWWADQAEEAKAAFANPVDLRKGMQGFADFILSLSNDIQDDQAHDVLIWGHGAAFDPPYLEAIFHLLNIKVPWFYRAPRDTRTCFDMAGIDNHTGYLKQFSYGIPHHALHDAITEAFAISAAFDSK